MNIGEAGRRSGLPAKTIRYYEDIGLIAPARRANGFRDYDDNDVNNLRFLARARGLGFSVEECRHLLQLYGDKSRPSAEVRALAAHHIEEIRAKIAELQAMEATLSRLVDSCAGNERPECPILEDLAGTR
jgi:Cu(I)-responsive transcriptional regulator